MADSSTRPVKGSAQYVARTAEDLPTWPEIRDADPELAARCRAGDSDAIVEFLRRTLGGTIIATTPASPGR